VRDYSLDIHINGYLKAQDDGISEQTSYSQVSSAVLTQMVDSKLT
jgi:hypothetical protein